MVLRLTQEHLSEISDHAERVYPEECCGLLLGELEGATARKQLIEVVALENTWSAGEEEALTKTRRYTIDPRDMLRSQKYAREKALQIIGIYHSHPDHPAIPSECDRAQAWSDYAYVIVSVCEGNAVDTQNWALDSEQQFCPEPITVVPAAEVKRLPTSA